MAAVLGVAVYAPAETIEHLRQVVQLVVVPVATVTGLFLWKQPSIQRFVRRYRDRRATAP
jgi:hypothetical protein